ncbi:hypothetical protein GOP47_0006188 [Adiantum capillus-veneris]|uniref:Uncharacterized protein n=1 Tax=Adiantum capillus-veneris TaxID=13818 RepID=A0A9D4ZLT1_ADICA|nr:hypothetical protein GOP47_0006188 [Adiantum capillus-veneris]
MSNGARKENSKLPVRRENNKLQGCYEQALFDAEMNPSDIMFNSTLTPHTSDSFFSPLEHVALSSKKELMESPVPVESPPVDTPAGDYATGNFTFTSGQEKTTLPSALKKKRKHPSNGSEEEHDELKSHLFALLENNSRILAAHVQSQNLNSQLDRDQRKEHADSLVAVLGKLAEALGRIADRL